MTAKTKRRLLKLAEFLKKQVEPEWFNLGVFADDGFQHRKCGTTACAWGWASQCFPRSGITLDTWDGSELTVCYGGYTDYDAAKAFFEMTGDQVRYLFDPYSYPMGDCTEKDDVARRIKSFVKNNGILPVNHAMWEKKLTFTKRDLERTKVLL